MKGYRFTVKFKRGLLVVAEVIGTRPVPTNELTVADMDKVIATEQFLEKLTGHRVHIETVSSELPEPM